MRCCALALFALLLSAVPSVAQKPPPPPAPAIVLEDQFQKPHNLPGPASDVIVLIYGDRQSATANQQVGAALHVLFHPAAQGQPAAQASQAPVRPIAGWPSGVRTPDVKVVAIACVGKVPGLVASMIRSQIRSRSPDLPVCLDFTDTMKQYYGLGKGVTNLAVIDTQGRVRCLAHGEVQQSKLNELVRFLEQLRLEARDVAAHPVQ
jgi:hypothetical protein